VNPGKPSPTVPATKSLSTWSVALLVLAAGAVGFLLFLLVRNPSVPTESKNNSSAQRAGKLDDAGKFYRTGLEAVPDYVPLLRAGGILALKQARFADAGEIFQNYIRVKPKDPEGYLALGRALQGAGHTTEAHEVFERGLRLAEEGGNAAQVEELKQALDH
jgi:predicted Zn-dependent protease